MDDDSTPKADQGKSRGNDPFGTAGHRRTRGGGLWQTVIGEPEDRKTRMIAAAGIAVVLIVLGLIAWANQRSTERKNLLLMAEAVQQGQALGRLSVLTQEVVEGAVVTEISWAEVDASGAESEQQTIRVAAEELHVGVTHADVTHRKLDQPLAIDYFHALTAAEAEPILLVDESPTYYAHRGERRGSVRKTARRVYDWLDGSKPIPGYLKLETRELAGLDLPLLLGEQWELALSPTGQVETRRLRSPREEYERFDVSSPVNTTGGLDVVLEEASRHVEFGDRIDPDLVYYRLRVRLINKGSSTLHIDPNLFQLQDDLQQVLRPARTAEVSLGPESGQTLRLRFLAPPTSSGLRFTIPGLTVAGGDDEQPLVVFLEPDETYTGDVAAVGDLLLSLDHVQRNVTEAGFELLALVTVANLTWDARTLEKKQFQLEDLSFDGSDAVAASDVSLLELDPFIPEQVQVTFPVGQTMQRADATLRMSALRKKVVHSEARLDLTPLDLTEEEASAGRVYIQQLCGAKHYARHVELATGGAKGVLGLLTDKKARQREAQRHLNLAKSYFPGSATISAAAGE